MFNTTSNHFNYNVNAVSGTLRKSHPKSKIIVRDVSSSTYVFDDSKPILYSNGNKEIVVLQVMLTGNNKCLVEFVYKTDFEEDV